MSNTVGDGLLTLCLSVMAGVVLCVAIQTAAWFGDLWAAHQERKRKRAIRRTLAEADTMSLAEWARRAS